MSNKLYLRRLVLFIAIYAVGAYALALYSSKTVSADNPSSLNSRAFGTRALYRYYGLYFDVKRSEKPWTSLTSSTKVLVVTAPYARPPNAKEANHLQQWLQAGGVLIYCPSVDVSKRSVLPSPLNDIAVQAEQQAYTIPVTNHGSPLLTDVHSLVWHTVNRLTLNSQSFVPLITDGYGCLAAVAAVGKGQIIALADSQFVSNKNIGLGDNAILAYNLVARSNSKGQGTITFDEYHHGVGFAPVENARGEGLPVILWDASPANLRISLELCVAILALLAVNSNCVLGPKYRLVPTTEQNTHNLVRGVASLMKRARADSIALEVLTSDLKQAVIARFNLPPEADLPEIAAALHRSNSPIADELGTLFVQLTTAAATPPRDLNKLLMQLERMRRTITVD